MRWNWAHLARHRSYLIPLGTLAARAQWQIVRLDEIRDRLPQRRPEAVLAWWFALCDGVRFREGRPELSALDTREIIRHLYVPAGDRQLRRFQRRLWARYGRAWDQYDAVVTHLQAATDAAYRDCIKSLSEVESQRADLLWQLMGRAVLVAGEAAALGRVGLLDGAHARTRTLLEVAVTGDLLSTAQLSTLQHYRAQHLLSMRTAAQSHIDHVVDLFGAQAQEDADFARARVSELTHELEDLVSRGVVPPSGQRKGTYWWARTELVARGAPGSTPNAPVGFDAALAVTSLARFKPYYYFFNTPTHAGSDALDALLVRRSLDPADERHVFLTGPSDASPVDAAQVALLCIRDLAGSALQSLSAADGSTSIDGRLGILLDILDLAIDEVMSSMSARSPENDEGNRRYRAEDGGEPR